MSKKINVSDAVRSVQIGKCVIRTPKIRGSLDSVFISKSQSSRIEYVYKFNHPALALKNAVVARMLNDHGIPAPEINIHLNSGQCFEQYRIIPGKTLYECIGDGMDSSAIDSVYAEILAMFYKMSMINWRSIDSMKYSKTHHVAKINISDVNNPFVGNLFSRAVQLMNIGTESNRGLYHCGITPKNIIIDPDGHVAGLVDMDEVAIADKNYAFGMMAAKYYQLRGQINNLIDQYELISGQTLNAPKIRSISTVTNFGKYIMWHMANWRSKTK